MNAKKIFNPKGWLILFAVLLTVMFLLAQLLVTTTAVEMAWGEGMGEGNVRQHAGFCGFQMGTLGMAYTPMLLAMASITTGGMRAKMTLITKLSIRVVAARNTSMSIQQAGYMEDIPLAMMFGMPVFLSGWSLTSGVLHPNPSEGCARYG